MDVYDKYLRKAILKINEDKNLNSFDVYALMHIIGTTQYPVAKAVSDLLIRKGIVEKIGKKYFIVGRKKETEDVLDS